MVELKMLCLEARSKVKDVFELHSDKRFEDRLDSSIAAIEHLTDELSKASHKSLYQCSRIAIGVAIGSMYFCDVQNFLYSA